MAQLLTFLIERYVKKRRLNNSSEPDDDIDRISYLPEELRVHIISFLKIKEAVQTSVLSKAWKYTWADLPFLVFDLREFLLDNPDYKLSGELKGEYEHKFEKFDKAVLQNREKSDLSHMVLFWLDSVTDAEECVSCNSEAFKDCILQALEFKPRFLAVSFCKHKLSSSYDIFTCASLEEVYLVTKGDHTIEIAPNSVRLPCLKRLDLDNVTVNDGFLDKLFFGCPIIEELILHSCILNVSRISSGRLKRLALLPCGFSKSGPDLINSLSDFTRLSLAVPGTEVKGLFEKGPIFKNLKSLELGGWCQNSDFDLVSFFLRSPNLENLTLNGYRLKPGVVADDKSNWKEPKVVMDQCERLEQVKIRKRDMSDKWVDQLKKNLHAHVKTIGKIKLI